jgi:hypothetical protein
MSTGGHSRRDVAIDIGVTEVDKARCIIVSLDALCKQQPLTCRLIDLSTQIREKSSLRDDIDGILSFSMEVFVVPLVLFRERPSSKINQRERSGQPD